MDPSTTEGTSTTGSDEGKQLHAPPIPHLHDAVDRDSGVLYVPTSESGLGPLQSCEGPAT